MRPGLWGDDEAVAVSLVGDDGVPALRAALARALWKGERLRDSAAVTNIRHIALLETARAALTRASDAAEHAAAEELVLADLAGRPARPRGDLRPADARRGDGSGSSSRFCIGGK